MKVFINGESIILPTNSTIECALEIHFKSKRRPTFALALNQAFVGKTLYASTQLKHGDSIDILLPIQGG
ncbi:sulfur carrier protein ThiS [Thalassotalea atypica]|uniref:sulfur carrier protein ThiS n=1 Tax=Thalassotalea atypica TaxID=2054316 RepID=UPI002573BD8E|nr:sulfur carrier protein ThiS [Thalassotalea atypica]